MTGTSINTPTTVASAAPEDNPNIIVAVAIATSKWLLAPTKADGAASSYLNFINFANPYVNPKIKIVCINNGIAIHKIVKGLVKIISPLNEKRRINVINKARIETGVSM